MRKVFFIIFILITLSSVSLSQLEIEEALFYPDRVTIIEKGVMLLTQGRNALGFIPSNADRRYLNVALNCDKANLIGIDLEDPKKSKEYKKIKREIEILNNKIEKLNKEKNFYQQLIKTLIQSDFVSKQGLSAVMKNYKLLSQKIEDIERSISSLKEKLDKFVKKLDQLKNEKLLYVIIEGTDQCEVAVRYTTPLGRWEPFYKLSYSENQITLSLRAKASQFTYKDWKNVSVSFSSSRPISYLVIPEPHPLFLYTLRKPKRIIPLRAKVKTLGTVEKSLATAIRTENLFYYKLDTPITLKSGEEKLLLLKSWKWKIKPERIVVPASSRNVYVRAKVLRPKDPLMNGIVEIISGNFVIGTSFLSKLEKGKYLELPLGIDEEIEVKRELVDKKIDEKWGGDIEIYIKYRITLFNNRENSVELKVFEPLPVSKDEPIKVKILKESFTIKPDKINETGIAFWKLNLKPKEKKIIEYAFKVRYPKDKELNIHF